LKKGGERKDIEKRERKEKEKLQESANKIGKSIF
jgi:hypothetical protein